MWSQGDQMRAEGRAFAQQQRVPYPIYSLKLKQRLLQEAASRRGRVEAASSSASTAESNFTKIVNKVERIDLNDINEDDRNGNSSSPKATTKEKKGSLDLKLEDAENENNLSR